MRNGTGSIILFDYAESPVLHHIVHKGDSAQTNSQGSSLRLFVQFCGMTVSIRYSIKTVPSVLPELPG